MSGTVSEFLSERKNEAHILFFVCFHASERPNKEVLNELNLSCDYWELPEQTNQRMPINTFFFFLYNKRLKVMYIHKLCLGINLKEHISLRDLGRALVSLVGYLYKQQEPINIKKEVGIIIPNRRFLVSEYIYRNNYVCVVIVKTSSSLQFI